MAAVSAMLAGAIHLAVVPQHWSAWQISAFFVVLGLGQLLWEPPCAGGSHRSC